MATKKASSFKPEKAPKISVLKMADQFIAWKNEALDAAEFTYFRISSHVSMKTSSVYNILRSMKATKSYWIFVFEK
jgi:hypothetical protein